MYLTNSAADGGAGAAQAELTSAKNDLGAAEVTVSSLQSQLTSIPQTVASDQLPTLSGNGFSGGSSSPMAMLEQDEQKLLEMHSKYTDNYPDVIALKQEIAQLEKEVTQANNSKTPTRPSIGCAKSGLCRCADKIVQCPSPIGAPSAPGRCRHRQAGSRQEEHGSDSCHQ